MKGISQRQVFAAIGAVEALKDDTPLIEGSIADYYQDGWNDALDAARQTLLDAFSNESELQSHVLAAAALDERLYSLMREHNR